MRYENSFGVLEVQAEGGYAWLFLHKRMGFTVVLSFGGWNWAASRNAKAFAVSAGPICVAGAL